jgi:uncharacterized protein (DUF305 family)
MFNPAPASRPQAVLEVLLEGAGRSRCGSGIRISNGVMSRRITMPASFLLRRSLLRSVLRTYGRSSVRSRFRYASLVSALSALAVVPARSSAQASAAAIEEARRDSVRRPYTLADIQFMSGMIGHHSQAVKMASWAASHGASPSLQIFAGRISTGQTAEIGLMSQWLRERSQPVPAPDPRGMKMTMDGIEHYMLMPGMLTEAQMAQLDSARGVEFDRLFLAFMIGHHRGAVSMVDALFATPAAAQDEIVFKFANDVQADQTTEIDRMQQMLDALPPPSSPPNDRLY